MGKTITPKRFPKVNIAYFWFAYICKCRRANVEKRRKTRRMSLKWCFIASRKPGYGRISIMRQGKIEPVKWGFTPGCVTILSERRCPTTFKVYKTSRSRQLRQHVGIAEKMSKLTQH